MIHLDTTFIVDLLREEHRGVPGPALAYLDRILEEDLWVSVHVVCELFAGAELSSRPEEERQRVERLCDVLELAFPDDGFAMMYARLLAHLERQGQRIGVMDLLIGTAAVVAGAPLVTGNRRHFEPIPGLEVRGY